MEKASRAEFESKPMRKGMVSAPTTKKGEPIQIPDKLFFRIGDVADLVGVKPYVLRYWESEFPMIKPTKSPSGQRVYRRADVESLLLIKHLLYAERYSIEGARKRLKEAKKGGKLKSLKKEKVLGGVEVAKYEEKRKALLKAAQELESTLKTPLRDLFTY